jgi:hypothetical protein
MIQGVDSEVYGIVDGCHVHDMVLDLIVSKSREANFVCDGTFSQSHTHQLAHKSRELDLTRDTHVNLPPVRSFIVWRCDIVKWALHPRFKLIRVLALEPSRIREGCHSLEHIGNLLHLNNTDESILEELQIAGLGGSDQSRRQFVKDPGTLCELRVLKSDTTLKNIDESMQIDLMQSLGNLQKMQHLTLVSAVRISGWSTSHPFAKSKLTSGITVSLWMM